MNERKGHYYEFGEFRLDAGKRLLFRNGELVHLTLRVFQLLLVLVENSGQLLEKNDLMERVWPDAIVEEANLKNSISTLRKALGDERGAETYIQTIPKRGYRFIASVIALPDEGETYLVEKRSMAEIIIDEIGVENRLSAADEAHDRGVLPAASRVISGQRVGASSLTTLPGGAASARQVGPKGRFGNLTRNQKAVAVAALLIGAIGLSIGVSKWFTASRTRPAVYFDKMKMTRLINAGNGEAVISPDGKYIAYIMDGTETDGLWVRQAATESAVQLLPHITAWGVTFTRDSNYVYCVLGGKNHPEGALYKVPALGGPAKLVLERINGRISFSPDGNRLVFKRYSKEIGRPVLITSNLDGSDERIILPANPRYTIQEYAWSPDGEIIAVSVRSPLAEGQITSWLIEIPADGGAERAITSPQKETITALTWLPDGRGLIMTAVDKATDLQQLWHLSYPSGQATRITNDSNWYTGATITSDGNTILAQRYAGGAHSIWVGEASDWNSLRKIAADGGCLKWTPDGRLLHIEGEDGKYDLWMINADGTGRERLTNDQSQSDWPVMSPDSRLIVFSSRRGGSRQIWSMDSERRNLKQLTGGANECFMPKITADGQWVAYQTWIASTDWTIRKIPIDGGEPVTLADRAGEFVLSPDGRMLAYQSFDEQKKRKVIFVKPMDGSEPVKALDFPDFPVFRIEQWTKEGLLCISADSTQIILLPLEAQQPRQLSDFKTGERIFSFALSPDGRQLAIARGITTQEAVMITDFRE